MANKWAIQAGTFTDSTIWNDGTLPQSGDTVYCNSYDVTISANLDLGNGTLTNGLNPDTNLSGGRFVLGANVTITANIEGYDYSTCVYGGSNNNNKKILRLNGNVVSHTSTYVVLDIYRGSIINGNITGGYSIYCYGYYVGEVCTLTINGNVEGNGIETIVFQRYGSASASTNIVVNGNATNMMVNFSTSNYYRNLTVTGNLTCYSALATGTTIKKLWVDGNFTYELPTPQRLVVEDFTIGGNIIYNLDFGIEYKTITYINVDNTDYISHSGTPFVIINNSGSTEFPLPQNVKKDIIYGGGNYVGTYTPDYPPESVVLKDFEYGDSDDRKTGTMVQEVNVEVGCVTPEDVRKDVPLVGMGVVGSLVVPSVDDVREGVVFDNGSVGTLIVQGGGDRLRIADFGYYTNAQSDTYIVDLTEQDKPKFAVAEERVLIEMFPDLDLENIPDKYFDDLFVKYLKYRLIVEYYRTAGINSTFTPSEPTTEIVNYQNVRNEVWLNSANIYLKAWGKKYPESITKPQRILL